MCSGGREGTCGKVARVRLPAVSATIAGVHGAEVQSGGRQLRD